jgi:hypothetical protein
MIRISNARLHDLLWKCKCANTRMDAHHPALSVPTVFLLSIPFSQWSRIHACFNNISCDCWCRRLDQWAASPNYHPEQGLYHSFIEEGWAEHGWIQPWGREE